MNRRRLALSALALLMGPACPPKVNPSLAPLERAEAALHQGDNATAIRILEPQYLATPNDLGLIRSLARAHVKNGSTTEALTRLETPHTAAEHYFKGLLLFSRAADASGAALDSFRKAVSLQPTQAEFHYRLGLALLESERYDEALPALSTAVSLEPNQKGWALPLAKAQYRTGQQGKAVESIRAVVTGTPTASELSSARALMDMISDPFSRLPQAARPTFEQGLNALYQRDQPQDAIVFFELLAKEHPDLSVLHTMLGLSHQRLGDSGRALDELKRAVELAPDDGKNYLYLASVYLSHQRADTARTHLLQALERHPLLDDAYQQLGDLELERRDLAAAEKAFRGWVTINPASLPARGKAALVYQLQGNWPQAEAQLQAALAMAPDNMEFVLRIGVLHAERFQWARSVPEKKQASEAARFWLKKVLDAQPENTIASRALQTLVP